MSAINKKQQSAYNNMIELKERNYRAIFRIGEHRCWNNKGEDNCVNLYRVINEDISRNPVYKDKNRKQESI